MPLHRLAATLLLLLAPSAAAGQAAEPPRLPADCDYRRCAYNIVPRLSGLVVTRGAEDVPMGALGFLWTRDISPVFFAEAQASARAAVRTRRIAALMTDVGLVAAIAGAVGAGGESPNDSQRLAMIGGAALLGLSVPVHFVADGHLARAVWLHNERYSSRPPR